MSLYKRPNSQYWWCSFRVAGKKYQYSTKTGNKSRARQIETALKEKIRLKAHYGLIFGEQTSPPFSVAADAWLVEKEHDIKESSHLRYSKSVKNLKKFFGDAPCHEITPEDVHLFKTARLKAHAPATVAHELVTLKGILKRLVRRDELDRSPADQVRPPVVNAIYDRVLDDDEMQAYLKAASPMMSDFAIIMSQTGARPSELLNLRVDDIHGDELLIRAGKTKGARRKIPLTDIAKDILIKRSPDLFHSYNYQQVYREHERAMVKAKLKPARLYSFRHKFATDLISRGVPDSVAAKLLGHSNLGTIQKYVHPSMDDLKNAVKRLEK